MEGGLPYFVATDIVNSRIQLISHGQVSVSTIACPTHIYKFFNFSNHPLAIQSCFFHFPMNATFHSHILFFSCRVHISRTEAAKPQMSYNISERNNMVLVNNIILEVYSMSKLGTRVCKYIRIERMHNQWIIT